MRNNSTYFSRWFIAPSNVAGRQHVHSYRLSFNYPLIELPFVANDNEDDADPLLVERAPATNLEVLSDWQPVARDDVSDEHMT